MAQEITNGALTTKSTLVYDGTHVDVKELDAEEDQEVKERNKMAIKAAINELQGDISQTNKKIQEITTKNKDYKTEKHDDKKSEVIENSEKALEPVHPISL